MDKLPDAMDIDGLSVSDERGWMAASLRYFHPQGSFTGTVREVLGRELPEPLRAARLAGATPQRHFILAWRSPTETLLLCNDGDAFAQLERRLATAVDGCMVDQTGGIRMIRVHGPRAGDLLLRLGSTTAIPSPGEARSGRLADVTALTVCVQAGDFLLLVERVYAAHLLEWIKATIADLPHGTRG